MALKMDLILGCCCSWNGFPDGLACGCGSFSELTSLTFTVVLFLSGSTFSPVTITSISAGYSRAVSSPGCIYCLTLHPCYPSDP